MTFAGSPDRVEARLVPEAGYELDTFEISGFPRRPLGGAAPLAAPRRPRRPGPAGDPRSGVGRMSSSAEAGTSPGRWSSRPADEGRPRRADGGRRPSRPREPARRTVRAPRLPRLRHRRPRSARSTASSAGPCRPTTAASRGGGPPRLRPAVEDEPVIALLRRARRRPQPQRVRGRDLRRRGPGGAAHLGRARLRTPARAVHRADYVLVPVDATASAPPSPRRPGHLARRRDGLGARRRGDAGHPRPVPARDRRPPDEERAALRAGRRRGRRPRARARPRSRARPTSCSTTPTASRAMSEAMRSMARPEAADDDRGGADRPCRRVRR